MKIKIIDWPKVVAALLKRRTQGELASLLRCRQSSVSDWARGKSKPTGDYAAALLRLHGKQ